jgi:hypothetical protein
MKWLSCAAKRQSDMAPGGRAAREGGARLRGLPRQATGVHLPAA